MSLDDKEICDEPRHIHMAPIGDTMSQEDRACRALWIGVIHQALMDLVSENSFVSESDRKDIQHWFFYKSSSFNFICSMASIDPEVVRKRAAIIEKNPKLLGNPHV